jgi:hypothetical protein
MKQTPTTDNTPLNPSPHTRRWTSHATTLEYTTYHGKPALQATTHITTQEWDTSRVTNITHVLWVSGPNHATLTAHHSPQAARNVPLAPYQAYRDGTPVEPCLLLAIFAPQLTEEIERSVRATLQDSIMAYLADAHAPHPGLPM